MTPLAQMKVASRTLALLAIFFASGVSPVLSTGSCVGTYTEYMSKCFKYVATPTLSRTAAKTACHDNGDGWLATLDTTALATGVITEYSFTSDTYFGLYKTSGCVKNGMSSCTTTERYAWDHRVGIAASTAGYEANMAA
jgi:hypothetical protein